MALKSDSRSVQQKEGKPARVRVRNPNALDRGPDDRNSKEISRTSTHRKTRKKDEAVAFEVKEDPKPIVGDRNRSGKKTNDKPKPAEPPLSSIGTTIVDQITVLGQKVIETLGCVTYFMNFVSLFHMFVSLFHTFVFHLSCSISILSRITDLISPWSSVL